jgi:predicted secreted protein
MAMSGTGGHVKIGVAGANTLANINNWTISLKGESKDTTPFGAAGNMRQRTGTLKDWSAKFTGWIDPSDTNGQVALYNGLASTFTFQFDVDAVHHWAGSGVLSGLDVATAADDVGTSAFSVEAAGALTFT